MFWLVTFDARLSDGEVVARLAEAGASLPEDAVSVPLGDSEASLEFEAPRAVADKLRSETWVHGIYPSSMLSPY